MNAFLEKLPWIVVGLACAVLSAIVIRRILIPKPPATASETGSTGNDDDGDYEGPTFRHRRMTDVDGATSSSDEHHDHRTYE